MESNELKKLVERFYEGQTTEQEEQLLQHYFLDGDVSPEWAVEQQLFKLLYQADVPVPEYLERHLSQQIDGWNKIEKLSERKARTFTLRWIVGVAAGLLLLFSVGLLVHFQQKEDEIAAQREIVNNPQDAYAETEKALLKFSNTINKGLKQFENETR